MTTTPHLSDHLKAALEHLARGDVASAKATVSSPHFLTAYQAVTDVPTKANVGKLLHSFEHAFHPAAANYVEPIATQALAEFNANLHAPHYAPLKAAYAIDGGIKQADIARIEAAAALTEAEAASFVRRGPLGYAWDMIARRWNGQETALEEFTDVKLLKTNAQKLAVAAGSTVGLGLVLHGGKNMVGAVTHPQTPDLEIADLGEETSSSGTNWTQLLVGAAEMGAGAALTYRALTGRNVFSKPLEGKAESLLKGCAHHGHASAHI